MKEASHTQIIVLPSFNTPYWVYISQFVERCALKLSLNWVVQIWKITVTTKSIMSHDLKFREIHWSSRWTSQFQGIQKLLFTDGANNDGKKTMAITTMTTLVITLILMLMTTKTKAMIIVMAVIMIMMTIMAFHHYHCAQQQGWWWF